MRASGFPTPLPKKIRVARHDHYVFVRWNAKDNRFDGFMFTGRRLAQEVDDVEAISPDHLLRSRLLPITGDQCNSSITDERFSAILRRVANPIAARPIPNSASVASPGTGLIERRAISRSRLLVSNENFRESCRFSRQLKPSSPPLWSSGVTQHKRSIDTSIGTGCKYTCAALERVKLGQTPPPSVPQGRRN